MRFVKLTDAELMTLQQSHKNGSQVQFRNRCFCLILSNQGKNVPELTKFFEVSRIMIYLWLDAWNKFGIVGLMNKLGRGRKPILSLQNATQVKDVKAAIRRNPQSVKAAVAELESKIGTEMHPETLKRFLKNLVSASAASAPVSVQGRWVLNEKKRSGVKSLMPTRTS